MTTRKNLQPGQLLLRALEKECLGLPLPQDALGAWAQAVVATLRAGLPVQSMDVEAVLTTAARALNQILHSQRWQFLLDDALARPSVFARTLLIMLQGHYEPVPYGSMAQNA